MAFVMFKADPNADLICDYLLASGVSAYVKGTGLESTGLPLAGIYPVIFVEEEQIARAEQLYQEWMESESEEEDLQEERKDARTSRMWVGRILLVFMIGGILFSFLSHYVRF